MLKSLSEQARRIDDSMSLSGIKLKLMPEMPN